MKWPKNLRICLLACVFFLTDALYSQEPAPTNSERGSCRLIYDENQHLLIPQKGFTILYFYSPRDKDSDTMKNLVQNIKIPNLPTSCFYVDISLSLGLKRTYNIQTLPSFVVLQDKRIIYGLTGFVDDADILTQLLQEGIEAHRIVSPEK